MSFNAESRGEGIQEMQQIHEKRVRGWTTIATVLCLWLGWGVFLPHAAAENTELTEKQRLLPLLRLLSYDRKLEERAPGAIKAVVLYKKENPESETCGRRYAEAMKEIAQEMTLKNKKIESNLQAYLPSGLAAALKGTTLLFVCRGLDAELQNIKEIVRAPKEAEILSAGATEQYIRRGLTLGIGIEEGRAKPFINWYAAKEEKVDLDPSLRRVSKNFERDEE